MEYAAFVRCIEFLVGFGMPFESFVSDRHTSVVKHMREKLPNITHYFDLWHLKKSKFINQMDGCMGKETIYFSEFS